MMKRVALLLISFCLVFVWSADSYAGTYAIMEKLCTRCHKLYRPFTRKKDRAGWEATINRMAGRKSEILEHKEQIIDFLSKVRNANTVVHSAKDPQNLSEMEKLHVPMVNAPLLVKPGVPVKIEVQIGEKPHPMTDDHYIYAVDIYINNRWEGLVELEPGQEPKVEFNPRFFKTFPVEVVSHCTVDGDWSFKTEVRTE